jgi:hypothetical protein
MDLFVELLARAQRGKRRHKIQLNRPRYGCGGWTLGHRPQQDEAQTIVVRFPRRIHARPLVRRASGRAPRRAARRACACAAVRPAATADPAPGPQGDVGGALSTGEVRT